MHDPTDVLRRGKAEYLVSGLDHGVALGQDRAVAAEYGGDARVHRRDVLLQVLQRVTDQRPALEGAHRDQARPAVGELEHLQRFGKLDELGDIVGKDLLGTDGKIHAEAVRTEHALVGEVIGGPQAHDARGHVEQLLRQLARHQIRLVALRHRDHEVAVLDTRLHQHRGVRSAAEHRTKVQPVLQAAQSRPVDVHHGDVVGFGREAFGDGRADLARAEDHDFHDGNPREKGRILFRIAISAQDPTQSSFLPVNMPSALSFRYKWVRSRPLRSATRAMDPFACAR